MIKYIQIVINKYKKIVSNIFSLSTLQAANYVFPVITVPYLTRILGVEKFGLIAFAQVFMQYFILLTDYGFHITAVRDIAINRGDKVAINKIFSKVMFTKAILLLLSFATLLVLWSIMPQIKIDPLLYFIVFTFVIGNVMFPIWYFQGIEKMSFITISSVFGKMVFTILVFFAVKNSSDYLMVPLLSSFGQIFSVIIALMIIFVKHKIRISIPTLGEIVGELKSGFPIFSSWASVSIYTLGNTVFLGLLTNNTCVGYYSAGEKLMKACQRLFGPIVQSVYPHLSLVSSRSREQGIRFFNKLLVIMGILSFAMFISLELGSEIIVNILFGPKFASSLPVIRILALNIFLATMSSIIGRCFVLAFGYHKQWSRTIMVASSLHVLWLIILLGFLNLKHIGVSVASVITETIVFCSMLYVYLMHKNDNEEMVIVDGADMKRNEGEILEYERDAA